LPPPPNGPVLTALADEQAASRISPQASPHRVTRLPEPGNKPFRHGIKVGVRSTQIPPLGDYAIHSLWVTGPGTPELRGKVCDPVDGDGR
jgi:hypothetical protein